MAKHKQKQQPEYDYCDTYEEIYGMAVVGKDGKLGYINSKGVQITPLKYDRAMRFHWDVGKAMINDKWGFVDEKGKEIFCWAHRRLCETLLQQQTQQKLLYACLQKRMDKRHV